jgi:exopolysaccharide production protein ExoZ
MSPYQSNPSSGRILPLEGMRGFAALLVFFVHFSALLGSYARPQSLQYWITHFVGSMGNTGVDIFFVISGFLMYGIVMRKPSPLLQYLGRRAHRLYPVFLFVLLIYIGISYAVPGVSRIPSTRGAACVYILGNAAMLPGMFPIKPIITVAWSLSYEWFFYLTLPLMVWAFQFRRRNPVTRIAMVLGICALHYALVIAHVSALPRLVMFGAGICLWELGTHWRLRLGYRGEIAAIVLAVASLARVGVNVFYHDVSPMGRMSILPMDTPVLFFGLFPLALYTLYYEGVLNRFFSLGSLRWLGNISYSYYLIHGLTLHVVAQLAHRVLGTRPLPVAEFILLLMVALTATILAGALLFRAIEKPLSFPSPKPIRGQGPSTVLSPAAASVDAA